MKQRIHIGIGCAFLFAGWLGSFLLNSLASGYKFYVLGPTLLIAIGLGLVWKRGGGKIAALALAFTALFALLTMNQLVPDQALSVPAIRERFQKSAAEGRRVAIEIPESMRSGVFNQDRHLAVFADLHFSLYAQLPNTPADMTFTPSGHMFVSIPNLGAIYVIPATADGGAALQPLLFHVGLDRPSGLVYYNQTLYVAEPGRILAVSDSDHDMVADHVEVVLDDLPDDGGHWRRYLVIDKNGALYVGVGSRCDACEEEDSRRGTVLKVNPITGASDVYAKGLRNIGGFTTDGSGQQLWATENSRVGNGVQAAPDEINLLQPGGDYGWPYCYGQQIADSGLGTKARCASTLGSTIDLPAGSVPSGLFFGHRLVAPPLFQNSLYVVLTEGNNKRLGRIIRFPVEGSRFNDPLEFIKADGEGDFTWEPHQIVAGQDGALYVSDESAHVIYRVSWEEQK